ncbi:RNA-binding domain-containing protein [Verrucomicrobiota bacterium]
MDEAETYQSLDELMGGVREETADWEWKSARGGVPSSMWETYSAMANTDGGTILLGVVPDGAVHGVPDPARAMSGVWSTLNDRGKVSRNLLSEADVCGASVAGAPVVVVRVPRAGRRQRPVFVGQNPLTGTYRRNRDGDYHCTEEEVGRMLADAAEEPADSRILPGFGVDDLDAESVEQYRNRFSHRAPDHPWLALDTTGLLGKLGAWRRDRRTGDEGVTVAGLLMFGPHEVIADPAGVPQYHVDYRERLGDDPSERWSDRITLDGTWAGNLFQFYQRVLPKLMRDLNVPFRMDPDMFRQDQTPAHEAIREAFVNALVHADHRGMGGVVVEKRRDGIEFSNPGCLLVSHEQILRGGVSECRNKSLQTMFMLIGGGEKAGSGWDRIRGGWQWARWRSPRIEEQVQPDRVRVWMPKVSLLPEDALQRLRERFGARFDPLAPLQQQILATAELEGYVSNGRMQELVSDHPADLTRTLQELVAADFLVPSGERRGRTYSLAGAAGAVRGDSPHCEPVLPSLAVDSNHSEEELPSLPGGTPFTTGGDSPHYELTEEDEVRLREIAKPVAESQRPRAAVIRRTIAAMCAGRFLSAAQLARLLNRTVENLQYRYLRPMVNDGELRRLFPNEPNRPDQAYTTAAGSEREVS